MIKHQTEAASGRKGLVSGPQAEDAVVRGPEAGVAWTWSGHIDAGAQPLVSSTHIQDESSYFP